MKRKPSEPGAFVCQRDLFWLLLDCVRYSLYRRSCAPSTCGDMIASYGPALLHSQLRQIAEEIETELRICDDARPPRFCGEECDHDRWRANAALARRISSQRADCLVAP